MKNKAFCSWSGGKDSALALWKAKEMGLEITHLVNMAVADGSTSRSHNLRSALLQAQAKALGMTLVQGRADWDNYETEFKKVISNLSSQGITTGVYGDIDLQAHRDWVERVSMESGVEAVLPLWLMQRDAVMADFFKTGFQAVICVTNNNYMGREWLGRNIDHQFVKDITAKGGVDLCGEKGEYHTFVYEGGAFKSPVRFALGQQKFHEGYWFQEILYNA